MFVFMLFLCSCNEESKRLIIDNSSDGPSMLFYGSMESRSDSSDVTKSILNGTSTDNTRKVLWEPSDSIYVTNGSTGSKFRNVVESNTDMAEFLGNINPGTSYFAAFPYGMVKNYSASSFQITLPSVQEYKADGISSESFPMVAQCVDNIFEFKNLCGILVLNLTGTQVIDSIRFSGTDAQGKALKVSGSASVSMAYTNSPELVMGSDAKTSVVLNCVGSNNKGVTLSTSRATPFHIVLPAGTNSHFTIIIYSSDRRIMTINSDKTLEIKRSKRTTASSIEYLADPIVYEFVDLGLSVNWATFNVGATKPEKYGDYFAWGETELKTDFSYSTYKYCNGSYTTLTKYNNSSSYGSVDNKTTLELEDDVARIVCSGDWRIPTIAEFSELLNNCNWTWTTQNGVNGYKVTSKKSGYTDRSIFLPAAGRRFDTDLSDAGSSGHYWSSSLCAELPYHARYLYFDSGVHDTYSYGGRGYGRSVRPVCPSETWINNLSIALNKKQLSLNVNDTNTLTATVRNGSSEVINNFSVTWMSSKTSVATVDENGKVTAVSVGTATITATCKGKSTTCTVIVTAPASSHEYVDLGLSVNWATCNVGALKPEDYGDYFAWGEIESKTDYSWSTYKYCNGSYTTLTKYNNSSSSGTVDNKATLDLEDDIAHVIWGGDWRRPTQSEGAELSNTNNCTWTWITQNGVNGYLVTSKKSGYEGASIFLPAAGRYSDTGLGNVGSGGYYWSSSLSTGGPDYARSLYFSSGHHYTVNYGRYGGQSVRPVCP